MQSRTTITRIGSTLSALSFLLIAPRFAQAGTFAYQPGSWGTFTGTGSSDSSAYSSDVDTVGNSPSITLTSPVSGDSYTLGATYSYSIVWTPSVGDTPPADAYVTFHRQGTLEAGSSGQATLSSGATQLLEMDSTNNSLSGGTANVSDLTYELPLTEQTDGTYLGTGSFTTDTLSTTYNSGSGPVTTCQEIYALADVEATAPGTQPAASGTIVVQLDSSTPYVSTSGDGFANYVCNQTEATGSAGALGSHSGVGPMHMGFAGSASVYTVSVFTIFYTEGTPGGGVPAHLYSELTLPSNAASEFTIITGDEVKGTLISKVTAASPLTGCEADYISSATGAAFAQGYSQAWITLSPTWVLVSTDGSGHRKWKTSPNISLTSPTASASYGVKPDLGGSWSENLAAAYAETIYFTTYKPS